MTTQLRIAAAAACALMLAGCTATRTAAQQETNGPRWRGIRVAPEVGRAGYVRPSWNVPDTEIHRRDGSPRCTPYTQTPITYVGRGDGLDREHIVALAEAWDSRPPGFNHADLRRVAQDHANLTLTVASVNRSKQARDAAEWTPDRNAAWMAHRIIEVKRKYNLSVNPAERDRLEEMLRSGVDTISCGAPSRTAGASAARNRATQEPTETARSAAPPVRRFRNCAAMRAAGWTRGTRRGGGTYRNSWDDAERRTYNMNTGRDRDRDGHACE